MPFPSREWHLVARPVGEPTPADFSLVTATVPHPGTGQVVVRNDFLSVDPYMRGRMNAGGSVIPRFELGRVMEGWAVGTVVASRSAEVPVGATVTHFLGWREYALLEAAEVRTVDPRLAPARRYLGVLGSTGLTAWAGLTEIAAVREGDVVFVSGAAGAVGSAAGQLARRLGASRVIGSAGGPGKVRRLTDGYRFDAGIDHRLGELPARLAEAAPDGIDVYFDNVGGDHLQAAIGAMNRYGRIVLCGAISVYNATEPAPGPDNLPLAIGKRLTLRGMNVGDHRHLAADYIRRAARWLADGSLVADETVVDGIGEAVHAFRTMMRGGNTGKMLVRLAHG
ncbi:NADP-dependent oxidoreductase [Streptomyces sp. NPDC018031]|uniref:NADP-dependent oxidoreductase n=1 Tax=Streptomyces sp. NPDC018031 TaxID=3365033 RepID=UPI003790BDCC